MKEDKTYKPTLDQLLELLEHAKKQGLEDAAIYLQGCLMRDFPLYMQDY